MLTTELEQEVWTMCPPARINRTRESFTASSPTLLCVSRYRSSGRWRGAVRGQSPRCSSPTSSSAPASRWGNQRSIPTALPLVAGVKMWILISDIHQEPRCVSGRQRWCRGLRSLYGRDWSVSPTAARPSSSPSASSSQRRPLAVHFGQR